ncbi:Uncharacterised protein [Salmonella enterica]|nr:Uncharacterised protein [Salmonella enterica]
MSQVSVSTYRERWIFTIENDRYLLVREVNGVAEESYAPVNRAKAAVFAAAIIQGFEPPRLVTQADQGSRSLQDHRSSGTQVD